MLREPRHGVGGAFTEICVARDLEGRVVQPEDGVDRVVSHPRRR